MTTFHKATCQVIEGFRVLISSPNYNLWRHAQGFVGLVEAWHRGKAIERRIALEVGRKDTLYGINEVLSNYGNANINDIETYKRPCITRTICKTASTRRLA